MKKPPLPDCEGKGAGNIGNRLEHGRDINGGEISRLVRRFKLYRPLKHAALFAKAIADPWGHAVNWPGDIDMDADQLYELGRERAGESGAGAV